MNKNWYLLALYPFLNISSAFADDVENKFELNSTLGQSSAYTISFNNETNPNLADFVYIGFDEDGNRIPVYYSYNINVKPGVISNPRLDYSGTSDIVGSFIGQSFADSSVEVKGGAVSVNSNFSAINITGDYINNSVSAEFSNAYGGAISLAAANILDITGDFINNNTYAKESPSLFSYGGAIYSGGSTIRSIRGNFIGNHTVSEDTYGSAIGGALYISGGSVVDTIRATFINNYSQSNYRSSVGGGALYVSSSRIRDLKADFIGNHVNSVYSSANGGAVDVAYSSRVNSISGNFIGNYAYSTGADVAGGAVRVLKSAVNFTDTSTFINNAVVLDNASSSKTTKGAAIAVVDVSRLIFSLASSGQNILFEDNYLMKRQADNSWYKKLNSIDLEGANAEVYLGLTKGTYVNVRDPITGNGIITKDVINVYNDYLNLIGPGEGGGEGSLYLWGDNSEFVGTLNINTGSLYAMFEENQTQEQIDADPLGQRTSFNMNNAAINFADGTFFRPQMYDNLDRLAQLSSNLGNIIHSGSTYLVPYNISYLDTGNYNFANNYSGFSGWSNDLAELVINGATDVDLIIKRDLEGYQGLTYLADIYRKRNDLGLMEREMMDDIYATGIVSADVIEMFELLSGSDYEIFEQVHRASVRQHNRQVFSRVQNKDCPSCGRDSGYSDEHFWFNVSNNWIKKDGDKNGLGYDYNPTGFAIGYDYDFIPDELNAGLAISYATGEVKNKTIGSSKSRNDVNEYLASFYGKYKVIRPYFSWNTGLGLITNKTKLTSSSINTRGEYDTYVFFANLETGYDFGETTCEVFEPYIGFEVTHIFSEGYNEKGAAARHFDRMDWTIFEVPIGIRASKDLFWNEYIFTPAIDAAYARNFGDTSAKTTAAFVGNAADKWSISSSSDKRDSLRLNLSLKINNLILPFAFNIGYSVDYRSDYTDQQLYGTIRWNF